MAIVGGQAARQRKGKIRSLFQSGPTSVSSCLFFAFLYLSANIPSSVPATEFFIDTISATRNIRNKRAAERGWQMEGGMKTWSCKNSGQPIDGGLRTKARVTFNPPLSFLTTLSRRRSRGAVTKFSRTFAFSVGTGIFCFSQKPFPPDHFDAQFIAREHLTIGAMGERKERNRNAK